MSAFKDSSHQWWNQCQQCRQAWFVGGKPDDVDEEVTCPHCEAQDLRFISARAEALEEAAKDMERRAEAAWEHDSSSDAYWRSAASCIRALITTPAPTSLPVERVREVLLSLKGEVLASDMFLVDNAARRLGVDLDAKEEATPTSCKCGHGEGWHHYGAKGGCMKKMDDRTTCVCKAWTPAVSP